MNEVSSRFLSRATRGVRFLCRTMADTPGRRFLSSVMAAHCNGSGHVPGCDKAIRDAFRRLKSLKEKGQASGEQHELKSVTDKTVTEIRQHGGPDVTGYVHSFSDMDLLHAIKRHPDLTEDDFARIPEIVDEWDSIEYKNTDKGKRLVYQKTIHGKQYTVVERIGTKRRHHTSLLMFTTQYINGKK
ncbi:MAG: hypothetical protein Q4F30_09875 [Akkermansia sp.]|nr:hypothetical protein [Akkermansia sp.]